MSFSFDAIIACTATGGIGYRGSIPWRLSHDLAVFSRLTRGAKTPSGKENDGGSPVNAVIMGRKTFESLPPKFRPLPGRLNVVISRNNWQKIIAPIQDAHGMKQGGEEASCSVESQLKRLQIEPKQPLVVSSFEDALALVRSLQERTPVSVKDVFVIGGASVYEAAWRSPHLRSIYLTRVGSGKDDIETDAAVSTDVFDSLGWAKRSKGGATAVAGFVPTYISRTYATFDPPGLQYDFVHLARGSAAAISSAAVPSDSTAPGPWSLLDAIVAEGALGRKPACVESGSQLRVAACPSVRCRDHPEFQYLDAIAEIINDGIKQPDRTGVGVLAKYGMLMRYPLGETFPLLTTKTVFWRGIVEELLWFIRGSTNAKDLSAKGVKIWDANGSREFLDSRGLSHREEGDLGPVYGFQWRHFGARYVNMHTDYSGEGVDQLKQIINQIKGDPYSRRIIMSAWNPAALPEMALPPCHLLCQFFVTPEQRLSCLLYQRSADMGLGVPFNIASYSLLALLVAQVCDLAPGEFIHVLGHAHVYLTHVEALKEQLKRYPLPFPRVRLDPSIKNIDDFDAKHIELIGYKSWPKISMPMAV